MMMRSALCSAVLLAFTTFAWGADKPESKAAVKPPAKVAPKKAATKAPPKAVAKAAPKTAAKAPPKPVTKAAANPVTKAAAKPVTKAAAKPGGKAPAKTAAKPAAKTATKVAAKPAPPPLMGPALRPAPSAAPRTFAATYVPASIPPAVLSGKGETLTCTEGTEDRHARIGVVLIGGKVDSFAYYSKWKPRTCSIYLQRNRDSYSKWVEKGSVTSVSLERGLFLIEQDKGAYRFVFRDVDRERYCGMEGTINGTLTVRKGSERCELTGVMEEGVPLGQAYAHLDQDAPVVAEAEPAPGAPAPKRVAQRSRRESASPFPISNSND